MPSFLIEFLSRIKDWSGLMPIMKVLQGTDVTDQLQEGMREYGRKLARRFGGGEDDIDDDMAEQIANFGVTMLFPNFDGSLGAVMFLAQFLKYLIRLGGGGPDGGGGGSNSGLTFGIEGVINVGLDCYGVAGDTKACTPQIETYTAQFYRDGTANSAAANEATFKWKVVAGGAYFVDDNGGYVPEVTTQTARVQFNSANANVKLSCEAKRKGKTFSDEIDVHTTEGSFGAQRRTEKPRVKHAAPPAPKPHTARPAFAGYTPLRQLTSGNTIFGFEPLREPKIF